jgi:hypothetical protein
MAPAVATYEPRDPSRTVLYKVVADHLETFLASLDADPDAKGLPAYVQREFYDYLQCGILAHGFLRLGCDTCQKELLLPFSCKRRGFCPSCAGRRMAQTAAHLVECVISWVPTRQWVISVPIAVRYWMAASQDLTAQVHTIIRTTIGQYYVNQAVTRGSARQQVQPGSVTFIQRFGGLGKSNGLFHRPHPPTPCHPAAILPLMPAPGVSPHAPRQGLARAGGRRQAAGSHRSAPTGWVAGDGQPARLELP